ncbi:MAG: glycoside hydrolase family 3 N-terminal domain-containing protein [Kiritimatiellia bacterium]
MRNLTVVLVALGAWAASAKTDAELTALLDEMTLEEKVGQLVQLSSAPGGENGAAESVDAGKAGLSPKVVGWIRSGRVGSLIGACGIEKYNAYQKVAMTEARHPIPLLVGHDMIHGVKTQFPVPVALSCAWDEDLWRRCGELIGRETPLKGCNWTFAPMCDIARDPRWGRIAEGAGQDPLLAGRMTAAQVRGIQAPGAATPVAACLKHYVAYGAGEGGRDYNTVEMGESTLRNVYLPPFKAGIDAGVRTVMPSFNTLNGEPVSLSRRLLTDVLRGDLGFAGMTISDWEAIYESGHAGHAVAGTDGDLARKALTAGVDMDMMDGIYDRALADEVRAGRVKLADLDAAVKRVLRTKNALGLFEHPYIDAAAVSAQADLARHAALAREAAVKSCVLLKNEGNVLPLKPGLKVALVGPCLDDRAHMAGAWTSYIENTADMTLVEGFRAAGLNFTATEAYDFSRPTLDAAALRKAAAEADVIVAQFGERGTESGEGWSLRALELPQVQREALKVLKETGKPLVVLFAGGRPRAIPELAAEADAILAIWSPGTSGGAAVADLLTGRAGPSGRLTVEFPEATGQLPLYYNRLPSSRPTEKNGPYSSCYRDGRYQALYPFGYGLTYTTFAYANEKVSVASGVVTFEADVTNTGARAGVETVQVYTRQRVGEISRPIRELRGWKQVALAPGESAHVVLTVPVADLGYFAGTTRVAAEGPFNGWIAPDSVRGKKLDFSL